MFYFYILECERDRLYVGSCEDIESRFIAHSKGFGAKYTQHFKPVRVAFAQSFTTRAEAMQREAQVKKWSRAKKLALIENNINQLKHLSKSSE
jgi:putative endonuclease